MMEIINKMSGNMQPELESDFYAEDDTELNLKSTDLQFEQEDTQDELEDTSDLHSEDDEDGLDLNDASDEDYIEEYDAADEPKMRAKRLLGASLRKIHGQNRDSY